MPRLDPWRRSFILGGQKKVGRLKGWGRSLSQEDASAIQGAARVAWVAQLARLRVEPEEAVALGQDLDGVLEHVSTLQALDTEGVDAFVPPAVAPDPWRDDAVVPGLDRSVALAAAPAARDGQFWVPRIVSAPAAQSGEGQP